MDKFGKLSKYFKSLLEWILALFLEPIPQNSMSSTSKNGAGTLVEASPRKGCPLPDTLVSPR